ncbi:ornithine cyclodeaminase family protein [Streptomyces pilosus]|uniref:Alanine dehydrogenase n=1 Tax=Streptomyces pilosus TaxID=28893 RepID=A0A918BJG8_9ACTN|nr:ornithine cyclodeaminase family protein [Streptomyces pilosus]GGQ73817.1 alanine dehydrogenase [Streptomyces pilosus]GGV61321.1 alanine dehydrogenase [Streptomyces pilosus]
METVILTRQHIAKIVEEKGLDHFMDRMIARLGEAFREGGYGGITPARDGFLRGPADTAILEWMPHHRPGDSITIKTVGYTPSNPQDHRLPTIIGTMTRYDDVTGRLLAVCDGILPTAVRTGAAAAVASRLLARPDSRVLGLVGAGAQAVTQAHALSRVFPLERILVHDIEPAHERTFAERVEFLGLDVEVVPVAVLEAAADIICTVTSVGVGAGPVLPGVRLQPHAHVNAIGADLIGKFEVPLHVLKSAFVTTDHRGQALREGESQQLVESDLGPDLMDLCADPSLAERHRDGLTVFDSTGFALEDHIAFDVLLELAGDAGIGDYVRIEHLPEDALDPYAFA